MVPEKLTPQERRIVSLLCEQGLSQRETAARLRITPETLKVYRSRLYSKLGLSSVAGEFGHAKLMFWFWSKRHAELTGSTEGLGLS